MADFEVTFRAGDGHSAPQLRISASNIAELLTELHSLPGNDVFTAIGRASDSFRRGVVMGEGLDATTIEAKENPNVQNTETQNPWATPATDAAAATREPSPAPSAPATPPGGDATSAGASTPTTPAPEPAKKREKPPWA